MFNYIVFIIFTFVIVATNATFCFAQISLSITKQKIEDQLSTQIIKVIEKGDFKAASNLLQQALNNNNKSVKIQTLAGIVAEKRNKLVEAEKHFAAAAKLDSNAAAARNNYGAILFRAGKKAAAAREFAASLKINPNQPSALVNLAQIRFAENDFAAAREFFTKAQAVAPDAEIQKALVVISLQLGEPERAAREYAEFLNAPLPSKDATLGTLLLKNGLFAEAEKEFESVLAANRDDIEALVALAQIYTRRKNIPAAGKLLESAIVRGTTDAKIYAALAEVYQAAGRPENAIPAMRLAIEKEPRDESYRLRYGLLLIDSKAPAAAIIRIEEAIKDFPNSARLKFLLGMAQFSIRKSSEAQTALESALAIEPQMIPALGYLATIYVEQGKYDEAVKTFEKALGYDEKNALLHYLIADTLLKTQNSAPERAERELKRAIELDTNLALAHSVLGMLYVRQMRWEEARATLERAVEIAPQTADALYQLGLVYARLKRAEESRTTLAKFKELNVSLEKQKEDERRLIVRRLANTKF